MSQPSGDAQQLDDLRPSPAHERGDEARQLLDLVHSLELERGRLEAILHNLPVGVWIADAEGRLIGKNEEADRIWEGDAPLPDRVADYGLYTAWRYDTGEPLQPEDYPVARALLTGRAVAPVELGIRRFDGSEGVVLVSAAPTRDREGRLTGAVGINLDITERKRAEEALRQAKLEAENASQAKSQFLSTMSHELRTPLTAVIGLSELLSGELAGPVNERQKEYLGRVTASAWHLVSIIDEILTFSRSEAGKVELQLGDIDIAEIARGVVLMLSTEAEAKGLTVRLRGADERVVALTDSGKVRQVLVNLVGNAVKFTAAGAVEVELQAEDESLRLLVRDTGEGIPPAHIEDIFEPFVQVPASTARPDGGTGLGLAICRRLARHMGGDVTVESTTGVGSIFTLHLPRDARPRG